MYRLFTFFSNKKFQAGVTLVLTIFLSTSFAFAKDTSNELAVQLHGNFPIYAPLIPYGPGVQSGMGSMDLNGPNQNVGAAIPIDSPNIPYGVDVQNGGNEIIIRQNTCGRFNPSSLKTIVSFFVCIINQSIVPILVALALILFFAGVIRYVINGENAEERAQGAKNMIWGVIAIFFIVSVWGLVQVFGGVFGFPLVIPQLQ